MRLNMYPTKFEVENIEVELPDSANGDAYVPDNEGPPLFGHSEITCVFKVSFPVRLEWMTYEGPDGTRARIEPHFDETQPTIEDHEACTYYTDQDGGEHLKEYDLNDAQYETAKRLAIEQAIDFLTGASRSKRGG